MWRNKRLKVVIISTCISLIISTIYIINLGSDEKALHKLEAASVLENQVASIKDEFALSINSVYELRALIIGADGKYVDPGIVGTRILSNRDICNILYAPDSIVTKVYPSEGNESIIGLNLLSRDDNNSAQDAELAVESEDVILTGPYELQQGGKAFSARLAVRLPDDNSELKYSGLVSVTMRFPDAISRSTNNLHDNLNYDFILEKRMPDSGEYHNIYSGRISEQSDFVSSDFSISNIDFRLSIVPQHGWFSKSGFSLRIISLIAVSVAIGIIMGFVYTARQALIDKSRTDALTGVYNRAGGIHAITSMIKSKLYTGGVFIIMDLDHFKRVNDVLGHQMGDEVLATTAVILKNSLRDTDIIARLGGDEFMMYLPYERKADFIENKLEDIRLRMHRDINGLTGTVTISSSMGVTFYKKDKSFEALYQEADEALYESKEKGRNRITVF